MSGNSDFTQEFCREKRWNDFWGWLIQLAIAITTD